MINYGYFRHRLDASNDPKLQSLVDEMGIIALGYYYSLLEIYGQHYNQKREDSAVEIHRRVIANTWRKRVDSCDKVLTKLQLSDLLVYTKTKNTYTIDIPNFSKYFGSYGKLKEEPSLKKRKEKKRKEKKIYKEFDLEKIYENYPKKQGKKTGIDKLHNKIKDQETYDFILQGAIKYSKHCENKKIENKFIKQFSTWVNQESWNDELGDQKDKWSETFLTRSVEDIIDGR